MNCIKRIFVSFVLICGFMANGLGQQTDETSDIFVTGVVYDAATLQPVAFADVTCESVSSDFTGIDGEFSIRVRSLNDVIVFRSVGYQSIEVVLAGRSNVEVYMHEASRKTFQQEVNLGYYSIKNAYSTRAVSSVDMPIGTSMAGISSPESAFGAFTSGLHTKTRSGITGIGSNLFVRGFTSLNASNQPLVVVDGMIFDISAYGNSMIEGYTINPLSGIDINDIENVTILKDAVAIYGAKAANGVIFITTNRARQQATSIEFRMQGGMNMMPEMYPMMDADQYKVHLLRMVAGAGAEYDDVNQTISGATQPGDIGYYRFNNNTDWQKEVFSQSYTTNYGLRIRGGDDVALYSLSVGYLKQGGVVEQSDYSRFNLRFNSDINFSQLFTLNSNISFSYHDKNIGGTGVQSIDDVVYQSRIKAPFLFPYIRNDIGDVSSVFENYDLLGVSNPNAILDNHKLRDMNYRFFGSFNFNFNLHKNFVVSNLIGILFDKDRESVFLPSYGVQPQITPRGAITNQMKARVIRHMAINNDFRARYSNRFGYAHGLTAVAGVRMNINDNEEDWGQDFSSANDMIRTLGNGLGVLRQKGGYLGNWNSLTYYLSGDYDYLKRYFFNVSMALDGSSRFGAEADGIKMMNSVFGFFPAVSVAWLATSEPFLADVGFLDLLKFRAGYGITGNDDIGNYSSRKYYVTKNLLSYQGIVQGNLYNPALKWETNTKINAGLDFAILRERLSVSVDVYQNTTTDMLDYIPVSIFSGFNDVLMNNGEFTTQGIDLGMNVQVLNNPIKWDLGLNLSTYKTEVKSVYGNSKITELYGAHILTEVGKPLGVFYGYKTNGVYSTQAQAEAANLFTRMPNTDLVPFGAGDVIFVNTNPDVDNVIDEQDMQVIGDPNPDFFGSITSRARWNGFTLDAAIAFSIGGDVYNFQRRQLESMSDFNNQTTAAINRWTYEGQVTNIPRAVFDDPMSNSRFSDRWIEDGSYARLSNLTLSYNMPFKPFGVQSLEVYAAGNNLLTITGYKGLDPDFSAGGFSLVQGIDLGLVPQVRSIMLGVKIGL